MVSPFARAMASADRVLARTFGETVRVTPRAAARGELGAPARDPDRPERDLRGVFTLRGAVARPGGQRQGTEMQTMSSVALAPATVWFAADQLAALTYVPRPGDRITLADRPGAPVYAVDRYAPSDIADGTFPLTAETGP